MKFHQIISTIERENKNNEQSNPTPQLIQPAKLFLQIVKQGRILFLYFMTDLTQEKEISIYRFRIS